MKIALIGPAYPYRGGIANYIERLARELQQEGNDVHIITFTLQYPKLLFPGKTQYSSSPAPKDLKITRLVHSMNPFNWLRVGRKLRKEQYDLVVIKYWLPLLAPCYGTILRQLKKHKSPKQPTIISILDNVIPHENHFYDRWLTRYFVRPIDKFIAMSESVEQDLRLFTDKPCALRRHPLYDNFGELLPREQAAAKLGLDPALKYYLFFGLIRDYKGLDWLMQAFADPRIDKTQTRLIVAGEFYSNSEKYEALLHDLHLEDSVVWHTHFIADEDVATYFSLADFIVQPYKSATQSGVTQIAYHFEKPMLVTNVGGLAEIVPNGKVGYVVEPQIDSITEALIDFSNKPADYFKQGIQEEKQKYAWSNITKVLSVSD